MNDLRFQISGSQMTERRTKNKVRSTKHKVQIQIKGGELNIMLNDFRFGFRMLLKNPAFTAVAVLSLALGIGANTAIFQLLNAVRLKTLPIRDAQQLAQVRLRESDIGLTRGSKASIRYSPITNPLWEQIRDRQQGFAGIAAWGMSWIQSSPGRRDEARSWSVGERQFL